MCSGTFLDIQWLIACFCPTLHTLPCTRSCRVLLQRARKAAGAWGVASAVDVISQAVMQSQALVAVPPDGLD